MELKNRIFNPIKANPLIGIAPPERGEDPFGQAPPEVWAPAQR